MSENNKSLSIKQKAIKGTTWLILFQGLSMAFRFGSNLILAWLLLPEAFGLMAIVNIFFEGLHLLSDVGLKDNIIRHPKGEEPDFYNTIWTVGAVRGVILAIISLILAKPLALFYEEPQLLMITVVMSSVAIFEGFKSTSLAILERNLHVKTIVTIEFFIQFFTAVVMIVWTYITPTIWGLVFGVLFGRMAMTIISHFINRNQRNNFKWNKEAIHDVTDFGKWIFLSTGIAFWAMQVDRILLGKLISIKLLGVYHIALQLIQIPYQILLQIVSKVIYPTLVQYYQEIQKLQSFIERKTYINEKIEAIKGMIFPGTLLVIITVIVSAGPFFRTLYKEEYHAAGWIAPSLALMIWFEMLIAMNDRLPLVFGKSIILAIRSIAGFVTRTVFCIIGYYLGDLRGFIIGLSFGSMCTYLILIFFLNRMSISAFISDLKYSIVVIFVFVAYNIVLPYVVKPQSVLQYILPSFLLITVFIWFIYTMQKKIKIKELLNLN